MAVTTEQKVDFLLKKVGYSLSKTGSVTGTGAISGGTTKEPFAETLASPITVQSTSIWADSTYIPTTPPGSDTGYVKGYRAAASGHRMTADSTVAGSRAFIAYTTYNNTSTAILGDWINTQFGADYIVKVYKGDPNSGGVQLSASGSGSDDTWFFDYTSGILNFNGAALPSGVTDTNVYIVGYRYLGTKGVQPPGGIGTFHSLYVSGITTLAGNVFAESSVQIGIGLSVAGISTFTGNIDANNGIDVTGLSTFRSGLNVIGLLQTNDDVNFTGAAANVTWDKSDNRLEFEDDASISIGDDDDLELSHDGTTSLIRDKRGSGSVLKIGADKLWLQNKDGNEAYLEATDNGSVKLYYDFGSRIETTGYGASITGGTSGIGTLSGPAAFHIDPVAVGDNTGLVVIKGNLQVDGTQTTVNSTTMTVDDKNIVLGQGSANDAAIDGGGITLESSGGSNKTLNWVDSTDSWTSSEHFDLASGKVFKINTTSVLSNDTLGSGVVNSRLTSVGTLGHLKVNSGITTLSGSIITGVTTITQLQVGTTGQTLVGITTILDEDNMASNSATALATQQSIKAYVDAGDTAQDLDFFADSGGALSIDLDSESLEIAGTANEITTVGAANSVTIGLPDNVIVGNGLTVTGKSTLTGDVYANANLTVAGISTFSANVHLLDNDKLRIGGSTGTFDGLDLYHDSSDSYISDSGTGILNVWGSGIAILASASPLKLGSILAQETQIFFSNAEKLASKVWGIDVTGTLNTDQLGVSGITTTVTLNVGTTGQTLVGINTILDEDNMSSDSATALATQQSIKKYIDDRSPGGPGGAALAVSADSGSNESIDLNTEVLDIEGTANEIETATGTNKVVIGLPNDVTIGNDLTVTGDIDANGALDVDGTSDLDQVNIAAGLNVTAGISTFAELINATKSIQGNENLVVTGISTFLSETNIGTGGTIFTALVGAAASVGIGSALPDYMLDVSGTINSETDVKIQGVSVTDQALNDAVAMAIALG